MPPLFAPSSISGITYASGIGPATAVPFVSAVSGNEFGSSGPWMIEEQTLTVDYWRYPRVDPSGLNLNLSSASYPLHISYTDFWVRVQGTYTRRKSYAIYTSAVETRMQLFGYQSDNTDQEAITYNGTSTGTSLPVSALGCDGTIFTSRPWYDRRIWQPTIDTVTTETMASAAYNVDMDPFWVNADQVFQINYAWCSPITNPNNESHPMHLITPMPGAHMGSTYDPDNDYMKNYMPQMLDIISDKIKTGQLGYFGSNSGVAVPSYEKSRHDYTTIIS
jgi:hypothetical protein